MTQNLQNETGGEDVQTKATPWYGILPLIIIGFVMTFLGFVFPGWLWVLNTPGDTEMITLGVASICGAVGVVLMLAGFIWIGFERVKKK